MDKFHEIIIYSASAVKSLLSDFTFKAVASFLYIFYSFVFDTQHEQAIIAILGLITIDFITGIYAAKVSGDEIKSAKVMRSAIKVFIYLLLISAARLLEVAGSLEIVHADEIILGFLAATELVSVIENIGKMGFAVPKKMLNKLRDFRDSE